MMYFTRLLGGWKDLRSTYENRKDPQYARRFADLYWRSLLVVAVFVVLAALVFGVGEFEYVLSQTSLQSSAVSGDTALPLDANQLNQVLNSFNMRAEYFESSSTQTETVPDPSLVTN